MDQMLAVRHVCEKYVAHEKGIFWAFMVCI